MKLYFARHGDTDATPDTPLSVSNGEIDEPLNSKGIQQANDLALELKDVSFDAIIASPLIRANQTANIINQYYDLPIQIDKRWQERGTGAYTDLDTWNKLFDFDHSFSLEHSEDLRDFFTRIYNAVDDMKQKFQDKTILVVSHGGVNIALHAYANQLPLRGNIRISPLKNCEYRIYDFD